MKHLREHAKYKPQLRFLEPGEGREAGREGRGGREGREAASQATPACRRGLSLQQPGTEERLRLQPRLRERACEPDTAPQVVLDRPQQYRTPSVALGRRPACPGPSFTLHEQSG